MKVADEVWKSVALLHKENPERADFTVEEIKARAKRENWLVRPGFTVHASYHCLANKPQLGRHFPVLWISRPWFYDRLKSPAKADCRRKGNT